MAASMIGRIYGVLDGGICGDSDFSTASEFVRAGPFGVISISQCATLRYKPTAALAPRRLRSQV